MLILYIHGFLSSPLSLKAQQTDKFCQQQNPAIHFACPALPAYPDEAISILQQIIDKQPDNVVGLIGSSLGGYYATYLSEKYNLPAVLVNPAVKPYQMMSHYLDQDLQNYHTEEISRLNSAHVEQLQQLEVDSLQWPHNFWLMAQTGDETLDYTHAVERYQSCKMTIEQGGDHSFQNYENHLPEIMNFLLETRD